MMKGSGVGEGGRKVGVYDKMLPWLTVEHMLGELGKSPEDCEIQIGVWRRPQGKRYVIVNLKFLFQGQWTFGTDAVILAEEIEALGYDFEEFIEALGYDFEKFVDVESVAAVAQLSKEINPTMILALVSSRLRAAFAQLMFRWDNANACD